MKRQINNKADDPCDSSESWNLLFPHKKFVIPAKAGTSQYLFNQIAAKAGTSRYLFNQVAEKTPCLSGRQV